MNPKQIKSGKYYTHTEVAGTTQLIQFSLSFSIYIKVYFYRVITIIIQKPIPVDK